jgi:hypothetical protein
MKKPAKRAKAKPSRAPAKSKSRKTVKAKTGRSNLKRVAKKAATAAAVAGGLAALNAAIGELAPAKKEPAGGSDDTKPKP